MASAVINHTSTVAEIQDPIPRIESPSVSTDDSISATSVDTGPTPPRNADAYREAIVAKNGDRMACAAAKIITATTKPDTPTDIPDTRSDATSKPMAAEPWKTAPRNRIGTTAPPLFGFTAEPVSPAEQALRLLWTVVADRPAVTVEHR